MKIAVRYYTQTGNTKKLATAIAEAVGVEALDVSVPLEEKVDVLFLGSSLYAGDVNDAIKVFLKENKANIGTLYNFGSAASPKSTYKKVEQLAATHGIPMAKEEFRCNGSFLFLHRNRPNAEDMQNAANFAKSVIG